VRALGILVLAALLSACSLLSKRSQEATQAAPDLRDFQHLEMQMKSQNYEAALATAKSFKSAYPYSLKLQKVRFIEANALEELGRWSEAASTYQAISVISEKNQPAISAMSIYRLSFVYEALGDDQRVITTLFEAAKYHKYLPIEVVQAEIPSRLAMVYAKENNAKEAAKWLGEADKGLKRTLENLSEPLTNEYLAELYYNMGSISTEQLSNDNILTIIQGQAAVQKYLIRALQYGDATWSAKALKKLKSTYLDLWKAIESYPEPSGYEPLVAQKMRKDAQIQLAGPFADLMRDAELYRPSAEQKSNQYQTDFFNFLEELQTRVRSVLESVLLTPLMPGRDKAPQKPRDPVKIVPSEDPNL
jgi:tetratricopeptide (TPR) repeat protein